MLQSPTEVIIAKGNIGLRPYEYILFNNMVKRNQFSEDIRGTKDRLNKSTPNMQQVLRTDMKRIETNKLYDRKLNRDLNGPKGLTWQCKHELQRLRSDERGIERDLIRLHRDLAKLSSLNLINRSPPLSRNPTSRLSSIAEEHSSTPTTEKPKVLLGRSSWMNINRSTVHHPIQSQKRSSIIKTNPHNEPSHSLSKPSFQQVIAKTSDDRAYRLHHGDIINQQKRLIEQKLKQFLH